MDSNHLATDYDHICLLELASQSVLTLRIHVVKHRSEPLMCSALLEHTHSWHRANHSSVLLSERKSEKEQTFHIVSNSIVDTNYHYKLINKHVTEVLTVV